MANSDYSFLTHWRAEGTPEEVFTLIDDAPGLVRWWPAVWLKAEILEPGDERGIGKLVRFTSKGWLPYILHWNARTTEKVFPERIVLQASGDFEGEGRWSFQADDSQVAIDYRWMIRAHKPLLRYFSFLLRPVFAANHIWAMARGEESLRLELARRHARSDEERARIPPPPGPVFLSERTRRQLGLTANPG
jgi:hypothetical protein